MSIPSLKPNFRKFSFYSQRLTAVFFSTAVGLFLLFTLPTPVQAAELAVSGSCTLDLAIRAANTNTANAGCPAGDAGVDTIVLTEDVLLASPLTNITSTIIISGNGYTIQRSSASTFRIFLVNGGHLTVNDATLTNGNASGGGAGGALYVQNGGTAVLNSVTITNNVASGAGGGIFMFGTGNSLTLNDSIVAHNSAGDNGGGLWVSGSGSNVTIERSTIMSNTAGASGGGAWFGITTSDINRSTIAGNTANGGNGGGIRSVDTLTLTNSTVSGNISNNSVLTESLGGGLLNEGTMTVNNSTITLNSANGAGGGIATRGTATINHSIVAGNETGSSGAEIYRLSGTVNISNHNVLGVYWHETISTTLYFGSPADIGYLETLIGDSRTASMSGTHPAHLYQILDETLANNGGGTLTHALVNNLGSPAVTNPAIDIDPSANCASGLVNNIDQRGLARPQDGLQDGTVACDAGAVEYIERLCGIQDDIDTFGSPFDYTFGDVVITVVSTGVGFDCLEVEEIEENHPNASTGIQTGRYWRIETFHWNWINGATITDTFEVNLTLPYSNADANTRACRWLEGAGSGAGWDCDGSNTSFVTNTSVTRSGISSFSDWAVGQNVNPTAVSLHTLSLNTPTQTSPVIIWLTAVLTLTTLAWFWPRRKPEA